MFDQFLASCSKVLVGLILCYFFSGIRNALLESESHQCPTCQKSNISPDSLIANKFLRQVGYELCMIIYDRQSWATCT